MKKSAAIVAIVTIITILINLFVFGGCSEENYTPPKQIASDVLIDIPGYPYLVFDKDTGIVYYHTTENGRYGYMSPYLGVNGNPCHYINGEIVEMIAK